MPYQRTVFPFLESLPTAHGKRSVLPSSKTAPLALAPVTRFKEKPALRRYVIKVPEKVRTEAWGIAAQTEGIHTGVLK